ncbi:MAG: type IV pilus modification protein PilV [Gammaproteobacteria bacterium]|nr:type IV pilus modification protein PilV [Gammaproteobacteria bacterium]
MTPGFSLLELLVAVLVVAVGALGIAGLQLANIQNNRGALQYSVTTSLANDLVERVRANPGADYRTDLGTAPPPFRDCLANDCTSAQLAEFDLAVWKCALGKWQEDTTCRDLPEAIRAMAVLPDADGKVEDDAGLVTVTVVWGREGRDTFEIAVRR